MPVGPFTPTLLCILDGVGLNPNPLGNAVALAHKPNFDALWQTAPHTTLTTFGERVGLPAGQMGNSEVGHLNIGAGRIVRQSLLRISQDLARGALPSIESYRQFQKAAATAKQLHLIGLLSDGGVHSHQEHLTLLLAAIAPWFQGPILLHLITDGRDTGPRSGRAFVQKLVSDIAPYPQVRIASIIGRFFAMDRDNRWERIEKAYRVIVEGVGSKTSSADAWLESCYAQDQTDEFLEPAVVGGHQATPSDGFIFWNFREDRARELVRAITARDFSSFPRNTPPPAEQRVLCFTEYDKTLSLPFLFAPIPIVNHLGEVVSAAGLPQLRTAETEKYPHVTYFFNAGIETPYPGEERQLIPSPREVKTYDLKPEMSAHAVTEGVVKAILSRKYALIIVNLANGDMVGHTGVLAAAISAVEVIDQCLGQMVSALATVSGRGLVIADHGNAEQMINYTDGTPHTAHTTFPVPCIALGVTDKRLRDGGALEDVARTVLELMGIVAPPEMTGRSLLTTIDG